MSHYSCVKTQITNRDCIVKALKKMGFSSQAIEVSDNKSPLRGYQGDFREKQANIRIKGSGWGKKWNYVGPSSNDLGFELMEDGTYAFHVSDFDKTKYNSKWQREFIQNYGREVVKEVCDIENLFIEEEVEINGEVHLTLATNFG